MDIKTAYLTIDDIPTKNTPRIVDFLVSRKILPVMFGWGERLEECRAEAVYALKKGIIIQNHSYSHPHFSELSFEQAKEEILRNEEIIEGIYKEAGVRRPYKLFRFPYGDEGGENKEKLQEFLKEQGFAKLDDTAFTETEYVRDGHKDFRDIYWTFDYAEWNLRPENNYTFSFVQDRVDGYFGKEVLCDGSAVEAAAPEGMKSQNIILIHDHVETEDFEPGYFEKQINVVLDRGVRFVTPEILR